MLKYSHPKLSELLEHCLLPCRRKFGEEEVGFRYVASGPLVRSSYRAGEFFTEVSAAAADIKGRGPAGCEEPVLPTGGGGLARTSCMPLCSSAGAAVSGPMNLWHSHFLGFPAMSCPRP